jgi:fluoroquinolone transport system permease protein
VVFSNWAFAPGQYYGYLLLGSPGGTILIFPFISLFFVDAKELLFAFAPGFWPAKAISSLIRGEGVLFLTYQQYYFIGLVYNLVLNGVIYKVFLQRTKT